MKTSLAATVCATSVATRLTAGLLGGDLLQFLRASAFAIAVATSSVNAPIQDSVSAGSGSGREEPTASTPTAGPRPEPDFRPPHGPHGAGPLGQRAPGVAVIIDAGRLLRRNTRPMILTSSSGTRVPAGAGGPPQVPGAHHRRRPIPLKDGEVRAIEVQQLPGLFGHCRENLRWRGLAGDQRRHPAQRRLLVRQNASCLL